MNQTSFIRAEEFIWKNARLLERRLFSFHFKNGTRENVLSALSPYQNEDGGFGNALEPDIRCPDSQPVPVQHALQILDAVGFDLDIVHQVCDYLTTITTPEGGVPWLLPSAHQYPRANWWKTINNPPASLNPTAAIAGLLHKNQFQHQWLEQATTYCWSKIETLEETEMHEMGCVLSFLYHIPDKKKAQQALSRLIDLLFSTGLVAEVNATGYVRKPLDWAPTPDHPLRFLFQEKEIKANLDLVQAEQQADGGWNITWPTVSPSCELEWRGWATLDKLILLRKNNRLPKQFNIT